MNEHCPLEYQGQPVAVPDVCRQYCADVMEEVIQGLTAVEDRYADDECMAEIGFSHDAVTLIAETTDEPDRQYSIVDECMDCGQETIETSWPFRCALAERALAD